MVGALNVTCQAKAGFGASLHAAWKVIMGNTHLLTQQGGLIMNSIARAGDHKQHQQIGTRFHC